MTKKDFQLIAAVIAALPWTRVDQTKVAEHFADALASTNPLFKRELFVAAATRQVAVTARRPRDFSGLVRALASDLAEDR